LWLTRQQESRTRQPQHARREASASNVLQPYDVSAHDRVVVSKDAAARLIRTLDPEHPSVAAPHVESIAPAPAPKKKRHRKPPRSLPRAGKPAAKKPAAGKKSPAKKGKK